MRGRKTKACISDFRLSSFRLAMLFRQLHRARDAKLLICVRVKGCSAGQNRPGVILTLEKDIFWLNRTVAWHDAGAGELVINFVKPNSELAFRSFVFDKVGRC